MGKSKAALPDLSKVIELKPDFIAVSPRPNEPIPLCTTGDVSRLECNVAMSY